MQSIISTSFSAAFACAWLGLTSGMLRFLNGHGAVIFPEAAWKISALIAFGIWFGAKFYSSRYSDSPIRVPELVPAALFVIFGFVVFSDFQQRRTGVHFDRFLFLAVGTAAALLCALKFRGVFNRMARFELFSWPLLLAAQAVLAYSFLDVAKGRIYWSDDHPSFLYRLVLLRDHFPNLPYYNGDWNAGTPAREMFGTGALNLYLLGYPFVHWMGDLRTIDGAAAYTALIAYILIGVLPWSIYAAARMFGFRSDAAVIAGLLALCPSMGFFESALRYGTVPFVISAALVPLTAAIVTRVAWFETAPRRALLVVGGIVGFLCLAWHLMVLAFVPLIAFLFRSYQDLKFAGRLSQVIFIAGITLALSLPSLVIVARESPLFDIFVANSLPGSDNSVSLVQSEKEEKKKKKKGKKEKRETKPDGMYESIAATRKGYSRMTSKTHAMLLVLAVPALLGLPRGRVRTAVGATAAWLGLIAVFGQHVKPQLELHRFLLPLEYLLCLAAGYYCSLFIARERGEWSAPEMRFSGRSAASLVALAAMFGGLLVTPHTAWSVYSNKSNEHLMFSPPELPDLVESIKRHGGAGRTFFAGFILHDFGATSVHRQDGGHVAPLAAFTGHPMYAFHYYHVFWSSIDPIPEAFRRREEEGGIEEFLDLVNATSLITFRREWAEYALADSRYREVWRHGRFRLFTRASEKLGWIYRGEADVTPVADGIELVPKTEEVVLKYRWYPRVRSDQPGIAEIYPVPVFEDDIGADRKKQVYYIGVRVRAEALAGAPRLKIGY